MMETIVHRSLPALLKTAEMDFKRGAFERAAAYLEEVTQDIVPKKCLGKYYFLIFGCALRGFGNLSYARKLNFRLRPAFLRSMRYELALVQNDFSLARKIRKSGSLKDIKSIRDFRFIAGKRAIHQDKRKLGLPLLHERVGSNEYGPIVPPSMKYEPFTGRNDTGVIYLDGRFGDVLLHLIAIRLISTAPHLTFVGHPNYKSVIRRYFPDADFRGYSKSRADFLVGWKVHTAMDYFVYLATNRDSLEIGAYLEKQDVSKIPVFGVCWRARNSKFGKQSIELEDLLKRLPRNGKYLALQADITPEEYKLLERDHRFQSPTWKFRGTEEQAIDHISRLAGVITVDGNVLHMAGAIGVEIFGILDSYPDWHWGKSKKISNIYPRSHTVKINKNFQPDLKKWVTKISTSYFHLELT